MDRGNNDLVAKIPRSNSVAANGVKANASYLATVLLDVTERGPLAGSQLSDPAGARANGGSAAATAAGRSRVLFPRWVSWQRGASPTFERIYDLTERVIPQTAASTCLSRHPRKLSGN